MTNELCVFSLEHDYSEWPEPQPSPEHIAAAMAVAQKGLLLRLSYEDLLPAMEIDLPSFRHQLATKTLPQARNLSLYGYVRDLASRELNTRYECFWRKVISR